MENLKKENSTLANRELRRNQQMNEEKICHVLEGGITDAALIRSIFGQWLDIGPEDHWFMILKHICDEASPLFKYNQYEDSMEDSSSLKIL